MRKPVLNRDYALIKAYKCWHCNFYCGIEQAMADHVTEIHPETLKP